MASAIFNSPYLSHTCSSLSPTAVRKPAICASFSTSQISYSKILTVRSLKWAPQLGLAQISSWNGLRRSGFSISLQSLRLESRKKSKRNGVFASLFGVGAPEALVIGVVALLVFGPKGLAEVAKNLGKTLRAFQPTIRELQEVSREFKSTLEKEIGLDELNNPAQGNYNSTTSQPSSPVTPKDSVTTPSTSTQTTPAVSPEDSESKATTPATSADDSASTETVSAVSPEEPTTAPADSQPVDTTNGSTSSKAYSSEDLLKITEEQLKAAASVQQKEQVTSEPPSPSQDS